MSESVFSLRVLKCSDQIRPWVNITTPHPLYPNTEGGVPPFRPCPAHGTYSSQPQTGKQQHIITPSGGKHNQVFTSKSQRLKVRFEAGEPTTDLKFRSPWALTFFCSFLCLSVRGLKPLSLFHFYGRFSVFIFLLRLILG